MTLFRFGFRIKNVFPSIDYSTISFQNGYLCYGRNVVCEEKCVERKVGTKEDEPTCRSYVGGVDWRARLRTAPPFLFLRPLFFSVFSARNLRQQL